MQIYKAPDILFVVAHPDDEMLVFGPAIQHFIKEGHRVMVLCALWCGSKRYNQFVASVTELGAFVLHTDSSNMRVPETHHRPHAALDTVFKMHVITRFHHIFTHDPRYGDLGLHPLHREVGHAVIRALTDPQWDWDGTLHVPYQHGADFDMFTSLDYPLLMQHYHKHYIEHLEYLTPDKYPLKAFAAFEKADVKKFKYDGGRLPATCNPTVTIDGVTVTGTTPRADGCLGIWDIYNQWPRHKIIEQFGKANEVIIRGFIDEGPQQMLTGCGLELFKKTNAASEIDTSTGAYGYRMSVAMYRRAE